MQIVDITYPTPGYNTCWIPATDQQDSNVVCLRVHFLQSHTDLVFSIPANRKCHGFKFSVYDDRKKEWIPETRYFRVKTSKTIEEQINNDIPNKRKFIGYVGEFYYIGRNNT